ncbi:hypothetical protein HanRHA438_Chr12g0557331 [Helianthus annuus]|nr:hypothetical protein HanRHA438_Chr12g0557331 [Helianthus annuus]
MMVHIIAMTTFNACFRVLVLSIVDLAFHVNTISRTAASIKKDMSKTKRSQPCERNTKKVQTLSSL